MLSMLYFWCILDTHLTRNLYTEIPPLPMIPPPPPALFDFRVKDRIRTNSHIGTQGHKARKTVGIIESYRDIYIKFMLKWLLMFLLSSCFGGLATQSP